jgi:hypothetical protein
MTGVDHRPEYVSWTRPDQKPGATRAIHKIVCVPAESLAPLETPDVYRHVPRRIFGNDGTDQAVVLRLASRREPGRY